MKLPPAPTVPAPEARGAHRTVRPGEVPSALASACWPSSSRRAASRNWASGWSSCWPQAAADVCRPETEHPRTEDTPAGLLASLELSLDRLDDAARQVLPRLGVFQGGAMEDDLVAITGLGRGRSAANAPAARGSVGRASDAGEAAGLSARRARSGRSRWRKSRRKLLPASCPVPREAGRTAALARRRQPLARPAPAVGGGGADRGGGHSGRDRAVPPVSSHAGADALGATGRGRARRG